MDNNDELLLKIDKLILSDELNIKREGIIQGHGRSITKMKYLIYLKWKNQCVK